MNRRKGIVRIGGVCFLVVLFALSLCFVLTGCSDSTTDDAVTDATIDNSVNDATIDDTEVARSETHYALYYANKELRELTYLDDGYDELNDAYDRATRAWYKGQYYMDLVTCGEITQENEIQEYLNKAVNYFNESKADAKFVFESLQN